MKNNGGGLLERAEERGTEGGGEWLRTREDGFLEKKRKQDGEGWMGVRRLSRKKRERNRKKS